MNGPFDIKPAWLVIIKQEADRAKLQTRQLLGHRRQAPVVAARHIAWRRMHHELKMSLSKIARTMGVNHTSVGHALRIPGKYGVPG